MPFWRQSSPRLPRPSRSAISSFAYLGKGFAEIIAFEVKKAPRIKLIEREQRNKLLEKMEFSLTGLTDPAAQLQIGKLLSVQYLVSGSITDSQSNGWHTDGYHDENNNQVVERTASLSFR